MHCPKCGQKYRCACMACKGKGWTMTADAVTCKQCKFTESHDWWFDLESTIFNPTTEVK